MNTNESEKERGKTRQSFTWLYVGLLLSAAGVLTGAALLIWHLAKLIFK